MPGALTAALCGALAVHLLPFSSPAARAAWCWDSSPPKCDAPDIGGCAEGVTVSAGSTCTPTCPDGQEPSCAGGLIPVCPPSAGGDCLADIGQALDWWALCGFGESCAANAKLGTLNAQYGSFECKAADSANITPCTSSVEVPVTEDTGPKMDGATLGFLGGLVLLMVVGVALSRLPPGKATQVLFYPGPGAFNLANVLALLAVLASIIAYIVGLGAGKTTLELVFISGLAAGLLSSLAVLWAFYRAGAHNAVAMSREGAWRIHIALGELGIIFGIVHGAFVFTEDTIDVFSNGFWVMGLVGLLLMVLGVLPALLPCLHYDVFKLLHFLSLVGYVLALVHMFDHAVKLKTARSIAVTTVNLLALVAFMAQKLCVKLTAGLATVQHKEVVEEPSGKHIFLRLSVPGLKFVPGKWGYLKVPSLSSVPHPFTMVPHEDDKEIVQFFIKVSGKFTRALADTDDEQLKIRVEGPYGEPPLPSMRMDAVLFVLGGVGVTPSLSLAIEGRKMCGADRVCVYWAVRSLALLHRCAPMLEPEINERLSCIRVSGAGPYEGQLPMAAQEGRADVEGWLTNTAADLASAADVKKVLLFCCGPASLANTARRATAKAPELQWHVHVEQFLFLPQMGGGGRRRRDDKKTPATLVGRPAE